MNMQEIENSLYFKGIELTAENIVIESLFHAGGTITEAQALEYINRPVNRDVAAHTIHKLPKDRVYRLVGFGYIIGGKVYKSDIFNLAWVVRKVKPCKFPKDTILKCQEIEKNNDIYNLKNI